MLSSIRHKLRVIRGIAVDSKTCWLIMRLAVSRYNYPGFKLLRQFLKRSEDGGLYSLRLRANGVGIPITLTIRPSQTGDVASFFENWVETPPPIDQFSDDPTLIVDAGAHVGCFAMFVYSMFPDCEIVAFEPNTSNNDLLKVNFDDNDVNGSILPGALWNEDIDSLFMIEGESNAGFVSSQVNEVNANRYSVPGITLVAGLGATVNNVNLVKLDIEGAEYRVLPEMLKTLSPKCQIWMELHDVDTQPNWLATLLEEENWEGQMYDSFPPHQMWRLWKSGAM